jgi:hypothetical protein
MLATIDGCVGFVVWHLLDVHAKKIWVFLMDVDPLLTARNRLHFHRLTSRRSEQK